MSNDETTLDGGADTAAPIRRRRLWVATGVAGLTGVVGLAALGGLAARNDKSDTPERVADNHAAAPQIASDAEPGHDADEKQNRADPNDRDGKGRADWDRGRVREVPCDDEKLVEAIDLANRDHGGTLKLAERCTYELSFADKESGTGLPTIRQRISIKGNDATIKRDSEDAFRLFRVADGGDLTLKDLTLKDGNAAEFKYGAAPSTASGSGSPGSGSQSGTQADMDADMEAGTQAGAQDAAQGSQDSGSQSGSPWSPDKDKDKEKKEGEADGGALLVERGGSAQLKKVHLTRNNAEGNGGAAANFGRLDIEDSKVDDNHAGKNGGGVFNRGVLKIKDTHIADNTAGENGGGIANGEAKDKNKHHDKDNKDYWVKGRDEAGTVEIISTHEGKDKFRTDIENNRAGDNGGGLFSSGGFVKISFTTIKQNTACNSGGGIYAANTDLTLDHVIVAKNHADKDGGGIVNTGGEDKKKDWPTNGDKKDQDNKRHGNKEQEATATISDSAIIDNTAGRFGGGIFNGDTDVKLKEGFKEEPGSKDKEKDDNATLTLRDTEIKGNTALNGGGIFNNKGTVTLTNTSVTKNTATDSAKTHRVAGGILNNEGNVRLDDKSTVTDNDPTNCGGTVKDCFN
ncbi:putative outer membrane repeat protein [Micromonospora olivasterospora]|uniref:Putative outer membrane repeat protein n=2 Tax=Micromonospora olivasterospora TaxID=1880 RepID=A0A562I484_MICOL|nr:putative outer membrane repeat protein [Micromonospora olivasterospora]